MQGKQRDRLRLVGLASLSAGVAFLVVFVTSSDHPVATLLLGAFCLLLALVNFALLRR